MKIKNVLLGALFSTFLFPMNNYAITLHGNEPTNIANVTKTAFDYYNSGDYFKDIEAMDQSAMAYLKQRISSGDVKKDPSHFAVVFDIDETLYSNIGFEKATLNIGATAFPLLTSGKDYTIKYTDDIKPKTLLSTQKLFEFAKENGLSIFIMTGNYENMRPVVEGRLKETNYSGWTKLILKPDDLKVNKTSDYKAAQRQLIEKNGYHILENIGDQDSDLEGGFSEMSFKLPNPFYFIP